MIKNAFSLIVVLVSLLTSVELLAQDKDVIVWKDNSKQAVSCTIKIETFKEIKYSQGGNLMTENIDAVKEVTFGTRPTVKAWYSYDRGESEMKNHNLEEAIKHFDNAITEARKGGDGTLFLQHSLYKKAQCLKDLNKLGEAIDTYNILIKDVPESRYLRDVHLDLYYCYIAKGSSRDAELILRQFEEVALKNGVKSWQEDIDSLKANVAESKQDYKTAVGLFGKLLKSNNPDTADRATAGEIRCLIELKDYSKLQSRSEELIKSSENYLILTAAYNGLGTVYLKDNKLKDARNAFLRGEVQYNPGRSPENEYALYGSIVSISRLALTEKVAKAKEDDKERAGQLLGKLRGSYPNSKYIKPAGEEVDKIK